MVQGGWCKNILSSSFDLACALISIFWIIFYRYDQGNTNFVSHAWTIKVYNLQQQQNSRKKNALHHKTSLHRHIPNLKTISNTILNFKFYWHSQNFNTHLKIIKFNHTIKVLVINSLALSKIYPSPLDMPRSAHRMHTGTPAW